MLLIVNGENLGLSFGHNVLVESLGMSVQCRINKADCGLAGVETCFVELGKALEMLTKVDMTGAYQSEDRRKERRGHGCASNQSSGTINKDFPPCSVGRYVWVSTGIISTYKFQNFDLEGASHTGQRDYRVRR